MVRTLSTYVFVRRRLTPALLTDIARYGVTAVEIFCSRAHFNYQSADVVREIAGALRDHNLTLHALHAPPERDFNLTHDSSVPLSICDPERVRRLEAVDEIKRALDLAEDLPFRYLVQHLGSSRDEADRAPLRRRVQLARAPAHFRQAARRDHRARKHARRAGDAARICASSSPIRA